jgi:hypothetical protein
VDAREAELDAESEPLEVAEEGAVTAADVAEGSGEALASSRTIGADEGESGCDDADVEESAVLVAAAAFLSHSSCLALRLS